MTDILFDGKCPSCGYQFTTGQKVCGPTHLEGSHGVCSNCADVFRIGPDRSLRSISAREYLFLSPQDAFGIAMLVAHARTEIAQREAEKKAAVN